MEKESQGKSRFILVNLIRAILVIAFLSALYQGRALVLWISLAAFVLTFLPKILQKFFNTELPGESQIIIIFFIYGVLFLGEVRGLFEGIWWWDVLLNLIAAVALGLIGLTVMYALYKGKKINASPFVIALFSFCFAVAIGALWEVFEFGLDFLFGFNLQKSGLFDTMSDMFVNIIGAAVVSFSGYFYIKEGKLTILSTLVTKLIEKNPKLFSSQTTLEKSSEEILRLIKKGEDKQLEFKASLRTNLHTNELDKKIEHAALKTMVAYLNSDGGTLLVGVSDKGDIKGLEHDNFPNNDKLSLYVTNLIKHHIGAEYLPFIQFELFPVEDKHILKVDCGKCNKPVFLKHNKEEEFYIRNGPSSAKLSGSALINYVNHNFKKK